MFDICVASLCVSFFSCMSCNDKNCHVMLCLAFSWQGNVNLGLPAASSSHPSLTCLSIPVVVMIQLFPNGWLWHFVLCMTVFNMWLNVAMQKNVKMLPSRLAGRKCCKMLRHFSLFLISNLEQYRLPIVYVHKVLDNYSQCIDSLASDS